MGCKLLTLLLLGLVLPESGSSGQVVVGPAFSAFRGPDDVLQVELTSNDDVATLRPHSKGRLEIESAGISIDFEIPTTALHIRGLDGLDEVTVSGAIDLGAGDLVVESEMIHFEPGSQLTTLGAVTLDAQGVGTPRIAVGEEPFATLAATISDDSLGVDTYVAEVATSIHLEQTSIEAGNLVLLSRSTGVLSLTFSNFSLGVGRFTSRILVEDSAMTVALDLSLSAVSDFDGTVEGYGQALDLNGAMGAIAGVDAATESAIEITGNSALTVGGALRLESMNQLNALADGVGDAGTHGGGLAHIRGLQRNSILIDVPLVDWTVAELLITADSLSDLSARSNSSPDGYDSADESVGADTPGELTDGAAASTSTAGAVAFSRLDSVTHASIQGELRVLTSGDVQVAARSAHVTTSDADGTTGQAGGTGVANAVAVTDVVSDTRAWLDEGFEIVAPRAILVMAELVTGLSDLTSATAASGTTAVTSQEPSFELVKERIVRSTKAPYVFIDGFEDGTLARWN